MTLTSDATIGATTSATVGTTMSATTSATVNHGAAAGDSLSPQDDPTDRWLAVLSERMPPLTGPVVFSVSGTAALPCACAPAAPLAPALLAEVLTGVSPESSSSSSLAHAEIASSETSKPAHAA